MISDFHPTPYPEINALLQILLTAQRSILEEHFVGLYLEGSLANGGFDLDSDVDFVTATDVEIEGERFDALQTMHARLAGLGNPWAIQLEGSYVSLEALRRHDPALTLHPNIERGPGEKLKMANHDAGWNIHRSILREHGICLAGPEIAGLIDPVSPADLRAAMTPILAGWSRHMLEHPEAYPRRGYQSYIILSHCRILYTLETGKVASKQAAAEWMKARIEPGLAQAIERAWDGRRRPDESATPEDIRQTQAVIRFVLERK